MARLGSGCVLINLGIGRIATLGADRTRRDGGTDVNDPVADLRFIEHLCAARAACPLPCSEGVKTSAQDRREMSQKLPLSDFRAVRHKLEPHEFAISEGEDVQPTNLIDEETWAGITHLPDDVAIRMSDHNGHRLALLHSLWGDWITATGPPRRSRGE